MALPLAVEDKMKSMSLTLKEESSERKGELADNDQCKIIYLPQEMLECIFRHMDSTSYFRLRETCELMRWKLEYILGTKDREKHWYMWCMTEIPREMLVQILFSYCSCVSTKFNSRLCSLTWEESFLGFSVLDQLATTPVSFNRLVDLRKRIRLETMLLRHPEINTDSFDDEVVDTHRNTITLGFVGNVFYRLISPALGAQNLDNLIYFDYPNGPADKSFPTDDVKGAICGCPAKKVRVCTLTFTLPTSRTNESCVPAVTRFLTTACRECVVLVPITEAVNSRAVSTVLHLTREVECSLPTYEIPIVTSYGDILIIWMREQEIQLHQVLMFSEIQLQNDVPTQVTTTSVTPLFSLECPLKYHIINRVGMVPLPVHLIIRRRSDEGAIPVPEDPLEPSDLLFLISISETKMNIVQSVETLRPQHRQHLRYICRQSVRRGDSVSDIWTHSAILHGLYMFWHERSVSLSDNGVKWARVNWRKCFDANSVVSKARIIKKNTIAVALNDKLALVDIQFDRVAMPGEVCVNLIKIREFDFKLPLYMCKALVFDFDRGSPYLFLKLEKKNEPESLLFRKLTFG